MLISSRKAVMVVWEVSKKYPKVEETVLYHYGQLKRASNLWSNIEKSKNDPTNYNGNNLVEIDIGKYKAELMEFQKAEKLRKEKAILDLLVYKEKEKISIAKPAEEKQEELLPSAITFAMDEEIGKVNNNNQNEEKGKKMHVTSPSRENRVSWKKTSHI